MSHSPCLQPRRIAKGSSLIELMIATLISVLLISGFISVYLTVQYNAIKQRQLAQMQEAARMALYLLLKDIQLAGYVGCRRVTPLFMAQHFFNHTPLPLKPETMLRGYQQPSGNSKTALPAHLQAVVKQGTDSLSLYRAAGNAAYLSQMMSEPNQLIVNKSVLFKRRQYVIVGNCQTMAAVKIAATRRFKGQQKLYLSKSMSQRFNKGDQVNRLYYWHYFTCRRSVLMLLLLSLPRLRAMNGQQW